MDITELCGAGWRDVEEDYFSHSDMVRIMEKRSCPWVLT